MHIFVHAFIGQHTRPFQLRIPFLLCTRVLFLIAHTFIWNTSDFQTLSKCHIHWKNHFAYWGTDAATVYLMKPGSTLNFMSKDCALAHLAVLALSMSIETFGSGASAVLAQSTLICGFRVGAAAEIAIFSSPFHAEPQVQVGAHLTFMCLLSCHHVLPLAQIPRDMKPFRVVPLDFVPFSVVPLHAQCSPWFCSPWFQAITAVACFGRKYY